MPSLSMFYGIIIYMYFMDNNQHKTPHIHAVYQGHEGIFSIPDGEILENNLPKNKTRLVQAWIEIHQDALMADWDLAVIGEQPYKIEPLK